MPNGNHALAVVRATTKVGGKAQNLTSTPLNKWLQSLKKASDLFAIAGLLCAVFIFTYCA